MRNLKTLFLSLILFTIALPSLSYSQDESRTITIKVGEADLIVEIAADRRTREKGLMRRQELPEGRGMLFVYPKKKKCKLWMRNTYIPLSAAFINRDGMITQIVQMEKTDSVEIYRSKERVKYALEVPLGWFKKNGIKVGDYCTIPDIPSR